MPRFQLIIREPDKDPRQVTLPPSAVVGRSRRANIQIEDEEVGREQFRLVIEGDAVFIECLGQTNRTRVDAAALAAGKRVALSPLATLYAGRTTFQVVEEGVASSAAMASGAPELDRTIVAPRPAKPKSDTTGEMALPVAEQTDDGFSGPMNTMKMPRPGSMKPPSAFDATGPIVPPNRASTPTPPPPIAPVRQSPAPENLAPPAPAPVPTPAKADSPPAPASAPHQAGTKPGTVALSNEEILIAAAPGGNMAQQAVDRETRLHEALPRLVIKGEGLKRRVRLMKASSTLGRAETADVLVPDESVSECHAEVHFDGTMWALRDCGSTNGCVVDGTQLRGTTQALRRHSLIGLGNLRAIFLCNAGHGVGKQEHRLEARAVQQLIAKGRIDREEGRQAVRLARDDASLSVAEVLLMETPVTPQEWATAVAIARTRVTLLGRILGWFSRKPDRTPTP